MTPPLVFSCDFFANRQCCQIIPDPFSTHTFFVRICYMSARAPPWVKIFFRAKPETPNPKPETRSLKSKTPGPKPEALNLKPQTLNPKPEALNLKPETPNPKPEALNLKP